MALTREQLQALDDLRRLQRELAEFAYWTRRRDELIRTALAAGMPVERLAAAMGVSKSVIRRIKGAAG